MNQNFNTMETRTSVKVEDDRSLGERAANALTSAGEQYVGALGFVASQLVNKVTGEAPVTDQEIAVAASKHQQLRDKAELEHFRAEDAESRRMQLEADAQRLQAEQQMNTQHADILRDAKQQQAEEVVRLENKQNEQQAKKCHAEMKKFGACNSVTVTKVTEIH